MKKEKEEVPLVYFERNAVIIVLHIVTAIVLDYLCYRFIKNINPWGFVIGVPASIISFHTLWVILNPYVFIFENKVEMKRSMFSNKIWYLIDIKKIGEITGRGFTITYNDDEEEFISTSGIRPSQLHQFRDAFNHHVCKSLVERDD
ncbi:MAG: hypothetical protein ACXVPQ_10800 [Bacteroidia bacterium]